MNNKLFKASIILIISILIMLYVIQIFFPAEFVFYLENERLIMIGEYIDNNNWLYYICSSLTAFMTYYLFCCASCKKLKLNWKHILIIFAVIIIVRITSLFDTTISTAIQLSSFLFLPAIMGGNIKNTAVVYGVHTLAQSLSLGIRNFPIYLTEINYITRFVFGLDSLMWLIFLYIIFNKKGGIK